MQYRINILNVVCDITIIKKLVVIKKINVTKCNVTLPYVIQLNIVKLY